MISMKRIARRIAGILARAVRGPSLAKLGTATAVAAACALTGVPDSFASYPIDCSGWWAPPSVNGGRVVRAVYWPDNADPSQNFGKGAPVIMLKYGNINGIQHAWAQLGRAGHGDWITLDITYDGGRTWGFCGPYVAGNVTFVTHAARTSKDPNVRMRACGAPAGVPGSRAFCTREW
jgi:hypothetical protein